MGGHCSSSLIYLTYWASLEPKAPRALTQCGIPCQITLVQNTTRRLHIYSEVYYSPSQTNHIHNRTGHLCTIDLVLGATLPNAPSYRLSARESAEIERKIKQLLKSGHIKPSASPCTSPAFMITKK